MPKHPIKLLVLLVLASATPATAGNRVGAQHHHRCPHEAARAAAAAAREQARADALAQALRVAKGPTTVTLTSGAPSRWLFDFGGTPRTLTP